MDSVLRVMGVCTIMCKRIKNSLPYAYVIATILALPLFRLSRISQRNATLIDYVKEFSNVFPMHGILDAITKTMNTGNVWYFLPMFFNLLIMMPVGIFYGYTKRNTNAKVKSIVCIRYTALIGFLYCIRVLLKMGCFDVDDILLNLAGLCFGMILASKWKQKMEPEEG